MRHNRLFLFALICVGASAATLTFGRPRAQASLINFVSGSPAIAEEVNHNFRLLEGRSGELEAELASLREQIEALQSQVANVQALTTDDAQEILSLMSVVDLDGHYKTIRITGANLQIVNGLGATNGNPADPDTDDRDLTTVNGLGNIIVGYQEPTNAWGNERSGSHNVIVGQGHTYRRFGGIAAGKNNLLNGVFASAVGGQHAQAGGDYATTLGGGGRDPQGRNLAGGPFTTVSGGGSNTATGEHSSVSGGTVNHAVGVASSIVAGHFNNAEGRYSSVLGGITVNVGAEGASVVGPVTFLDQ